MSHNSREIQHPFAFPSQGGISISMHVLSIQLEKNIEISTQERGNCFSDKANVGIHLFIKDIFVQKTHKEGYLKS